MNVQMWASSLSVTLLTVYPPKWGHVATIVYTTILFETQKVFVEAWKKFVFANNNYDLKCCWSRLWLMPLVIAGAQENMQGGQPASY